MNWSDPIVKAITSGRVSLLFNAPFFGNLATRMALIQADGWCKTAATDGRNFYYNREFIKSLTPDNLLFLIGHEVLHCFPAGTIVPGTFKPIEELVQGDVVFGLGGVQSTVVVPMSRYYDGNLVTIRARGLLPLSMTTEHPVFVSRPKWKTIKDKETHCGRNIREWQDPKWINAIDIEIGDWVQVPRVKGTVSDPILRFEFTGNPWSSPEKLKSGVVLNKEVAEFLGWYVAEGSTSIANGKFSSEITVNINERAIVERLLIILNSNFGIGGHLSQDVTTNVCRLHFSSKPFGKWLQANCGHKSEAMVIPSEILLNTDFEIISAFLSAYTEGDGNVTDHVGFGTVSKTLAYQMQLLWARVGCLFNLYERDPTTSIIRGKIINSGTSYVGRTSWKEAFTFIGETSKASRSTCYGGVTDDAIWTPVTKIAVEPFSGYVYNIETSCHTYAAGNIMTHNCVYDHLGRKSFRDPKIWNMANDYIVNYTLVKAGLGKMPQHGLYDEKYNDSMTSEEVYRLLKENSVEIKMTLDEHLTLDGEGGGDDDGTGRRVSVTVMGDSNGPPKITEADRQQIRNEIKAAVINAAQAVGAGRVPAGVRRLIEAFTNPKMDWRTLLELHIQSQIKDDFTFQRPSRRSWTGEKVIILPGQNFKRRVELVSFIDLSGSMTDDMVADFLSEIKGIMDTFEDFWLLLATFDTKVYNPQVFTRENADDILDYKPIGGGGTDFACMFDFMQDPSSAGFGEQFPEAIEPAKLVVFTDGYPAGSWGSEDYCDTLWILHGTNSIVAPFGMTVYYEAAATD